MQQCGEISSGASYTLSEFSSRTGLKRDAIRSARRNGLRVVYRHNRGYILGRDWLSYIDDQEALETDNAPEA
ncbi:hypothetical protein Pan153_33960 [Gimesia panareensis]|uniref:Helix-turn-helix domain-containing protein n=1 Tax=Gimesia panareensis TaxID=2527978 RepID=A0A518FR13_9PLAN|nr:hypothetical protein Pan153_33960 [Gimesia panareensis]